MVLSKTLLPFTLVLAAFPATAKVYCCTDDNGHKVCGDILPVQCQTRAYEELNRFGMIKKKIEAPLTPEQRIQRDAELERQKAAERATVEQARRDRVILANYSSVADVDAKCAQSLAAIQLEINNAQERLGDSRAKQEAVRQKAARYANRPLPDILKANLQDIEAETVSRQAALDTLLKERAAIEERFDQDRRRYQELHNVAKVSEVPATPPLNQ
jgi:hypothetical protein